MIQIKQSLISTQKEKETLNILNHAQAFEFIPTAKTISYADLLPNEENGIYLTVKITNDGNEDKAQEYVNGLFLPVLSVLNRIFATNTDKPLLSVSYSNYIAENNKKECLLAHVLLKTEDGQIFTDSELEDFAYLLAENLNIKMPERSPKPTEEIEVINEGPVASAQEKPESENLDNATTNENIVPKENDVRTEQTILITEHTDDKTEEQTDKTAEDSATEYIDEISYTPPTEIDNQANKIAQYRVEKDGGLIIEYIEKPIENTSVEDEPAEVIADAIETDVTIVSEILDDDDSALADANESDESEKSIFDTLDPNEINRNIDYEADSRCEVGNLKCDSPKETTEETIFSLNEMTEFRSQNPRTKADDVEMVYDLEKEDKKIKLTMSYGSMKEVFAKTMKHIMTVENSSYIRAQHGQVDKKTFMEMVERIILKYEPNIPREDLPIVMKRVENAVFEYYVLQKALDDPDVSDIKIISWDHIRVKVKGKRMTCNLHFLDETDLNRYIEGVAIRNKTNLEPEKAVQNFTDRDSNPDYILRFNITTPYVNSSRTPYLHIRKTAKHKVTIDTLIKRGMLDRKTADFLIDAVKNSRGLIFCGRGGCGKTSLMNALIEFIPKDKSGLVIQENEELFSDNHPDLMFQHTVISPYRNVPSYNLRALATNGLLTDLDYFIIGETKGAEAADLMSAAYSGTITWTSVHCNTSREALNKLADYVKLGTDYSFEQAKSMMTNMQYIIHLADYQIKDISEVIRFNNSIGDIEYRDIYKK